MPETPEERPQRESSWSGWISGHIPLEIETAVFIVVNVLDVFLTVALLYNLQTHNEGNPLAKYFLDRWGFQGLVYYKMALVAFVCVVTQLIARRRLTVARRLLYGLIAIVGAVDLYSATLLLRGLMG